MTPNVLLVMTDQQRFDTIAALGNDAISTPGLDRLVAGGTTFTNAYSTCPVCVPARYTIISGSEPPRTDVWDNEVAAGGHERIRERCGPFLAERMRELGYRTFGVGKFHTTPWDAAIGFERQLHSEEFYETPAQRAGDAYAAWIAREHPSHDFVEALMGERTDMYYMPQASPLPAEATVESWATDRALELIADGDARPWFGFVSYVGPHPPFAPPLPFNRMYDPDRMPPPVGRDRATDHLDQQIPWMNHAVYADDVDPVRARTLKARYYGKISQIDGCIGRLLDAVGEDTLVCFFSDHGDLLGDHHGWQKECFFEAAARVPLIVRWPGRLPAGAVDGSLACLTDLFGLVTGAAGAPDPRQGHDLLGAHPRERLIGYHGRPGTNRFKAMVRSGPHKLIWMANGGTTLLFDVAADPAELRPLQDERPDVVATLLAALGEELGREGIALEPQPYEEWPRERIHQFDRSRGVTGYLR